jgi:hypothetical protein
MITDENKNEFIEHYLMGRLSLLELAEVEAKIKTNAVFAEEVSFQRDIMVGIIENRRNELKDNLVMLEPAGILMKLHFDKSSVKRYSVAASIILIVALSVFYPKISDTLQARSKAAHFSIK